MIVDLLAGPGGWDEGASMLGVTEDIVGLEWDAAACKTAKAAGHERIRCDVATYPTDAFGPVEGLIASPPCQAWSMAGKRKGELDRANCHALADRMAGGDDSTDWTAWEDDKSPLVCQPVRWVRDLRPQWVALEEVPAVASLWEHFARIFRGWGYSVWTGDLCAADYGVPQLGWGMSERPSVTVVAGSGRQGGCDPLDGGSGSRATLKKAQIEGRWQVRDHERPPVYVNGNQINAGRRSADEPAPTILFGHRSNDVRWIHERPATTVVGSFCPDVISAPGYRTSVSRQNAEGGVRVSVAEGGVLQSFPPDYPWRGSRTKQYRQVGDAIPVLLAAHVLAALGVGTLPSEVAA